MISFEKINDILADLPGYRKKQVYQAIFQHAYEDWEQATNLPQGLRAKLAETGPPTIDAKPFFSANERAIKTLIRLDDNRFIEAVLMKSDDRNTICASTQVGCPIRCPFCASGKDGFIRNLTLGEIVGQIIFFSRLLKKTGEKVTNIVFMGAGEPLLNYDNVIGAVRLLNQEDTLNLSARRFSISTSGIVPGIQKLAAEKGLAVNLAISLQSAIDQKRRLLVPANTKYPLKDLSTALRKYFEKTKRKIMIEYVLIKGINTFEEDAAALREVINTVEAAYVVNLIPLNETYCDYEAPSGYEVANFKQYLQKYNVSFIQRFSFGKDISAACGQLALFHRQLDQSFD